MPTSLSTRVVLAAISLSTPATAFAGGWHGGGHGAMIWRGGGFAGHAAFAARGHASGGLPPVSGVIHERPGGRSYVSPYGHTDTAFGFGRGGYRPYGGSFGGYGHVGTALRYGEGRGFGAFGTGRRGLAERRFRGSGFAGGGFGGYGGVVYGAPGLYGDAGTYGGQGTYGQGGSYGTTATQSGYGNGGGLPYRSETPLAARFAEPPLAPSPYSAYSPDDRYAYAAAEDVGAGPRILNVGRSSRRDCACGPRSEPVIYRYGVGTAY